jgi:UTP--glucose-1-phosphate uridylyltransferase
VIDNLKPGAGGEIQLTDAIKLFAQKEGCIGVDFIGTRYDMGNKLEMLKAIVETALGHKDLKDDFRSYLLSLIK